MKRKNQFILRFALNSAIICWPFLLSVGLASGQTHLYAENDVKYQPTLELGQVSTPTPPTTNFLWNVWLVLLSSFPVAVIALFWLPV